MSKYKKHIDKLKSEIDNIDINTRNRSKIQHNIDNIHEIIESMENIEYNKIESIYVMLHNACLDKESVEYEAFTISRTDLRRGIVLKINGLEFSIRYDLSSFPQCSLSKDNVRLSEEMIELFISTVMPKVELYLENRKLEVELEVLDTINNIEV